MSFFKSLIITIMCLFSTTTFACTEFRIHAKDNTQLITRTMEYGLDMRANLRTSNRNRAISVVTPEGKKGMSWNARYGYVFFDAFNVDVAVDGINEKGLSFGALYLPGLTEYQTIPRNQTKKALPYVRMGDWILGNFSSVDEVKTALQNVFVYTEKVPGMGDIIFPIHFSIYDSTGKGLVVEYIHGTLTMHENTIGVLTNSPEYTWHITNLENYVHLSPLNPTPVVLNGVTIAPLGQGFNLVGLPGDPTPPSRFVKIATLLRVTTPAKDATGALNLASHIINTVDIPEGLVLIPNMHNPESGKMEIETTQWTAFKDLTHKIIYFHTYENLQLKSIALDKINFAENAPRLKMSLAGKQVVDDVTMQFLGSK